MNKRINSLKTLIILALACIFFSFLFKLKLLLYAALCLLIIGLVFKKLAAFIAGAWMKFAETIGAINTAVLLTAIFYLFLTPLALLYRFTHRGFFRLNDTGAKTLWARRDHEYVRSDLEKMW